MKIAENTVAEKKDGVKKIKLTHGLFALVSDCDFEFLSPLKWYPQFHRSGLIYAQCNHFGKPIAMHRLVMNPDDGVEIDHRDGNGLNNARSNLRFANKAQQKMNMGITKASTSGFKGVHLVRRLGRWQAGIMLNYTRIHLGYFSDPKLAAMAYDDAAVKHFGEFAMTNKMMGLL